MPRTILHFTNPALDAIPAAPKGKRVYYADDKVSGLVLDVTGTGSKTFYVYRRVDGKPTRTLIGRYPDLKVEQARRKALEVIGAIAQGKNPHAERRTRNTEMTFGMLFEDYLEHHAKKHKVSWKEDAAQYKRYLTTWGSKRLSTIQRIDVRDLHTQIGKNNGPYAANRLLALLKTVFKYATNHDYLKVNNPALGITGFKEKARERRLHPQEMKAFLQAVQEEPNETIRDFILMCLLTGARRANVQAMRWDEVKFERAEWAIPMTKNGTSQTVALTTLALEILKQRQGVAKGPFVFPGEGKTGHLAEPKKGWARILERSGLENLRLHDLRRTMGSYLVDKGASLALVGKVLNHKDPSTTAIYARMDISPARALMEVVSKAMWEEGGLGQAPDPED